MVNQTIIQLQCNNLEIGYTKPLLPAFDIQLVAGQFVALLGSNGVGKSTFLKTICGFQKNITGQIYWNKNNLSDLSAHELAQLISFVGTTRIQGFNLSCKDMIASGRAPYTNWLHQLSEEDAAIMNSVIQQCGLEAHQNKLIENLSDGLYQKTMVAKALTQQTPVILLDEPSAFLDYPSKHHLFKMLLELSQSSQKLIIISTHDLDLVKKYCTHVCLMNEGTAPIASEIKQAQLDKVFLDLYQNDL
jgi:iron complex transport system ATP-binding protein